MKQGNYECGLYLVARVLKTTALIKEQPSNSLRHPAGNRQENNKLISVDTKSDYTPLYHGFTQTLDKPELSNPEKQMTHAYNPHY